MSQKSFAGFWAAFGKLSAVLTACGTIVGIYLAINPSGPELLAKCDFNSYALPPDLIKTIDDVHQSESLDAIQREMAALEGEKNKPMGMSKFELARRLNVYLEAKWPKKFRYSSNPYRGFWYISIQNTGNRIANDVVLDIPLTGVALVTGRDQAQEIQTITKTLRLGSLRPGDSITVALWSEEGTSFYSSGFRLTHAGGVGSVSFPSSFYGYRAVVARNLGFILIIVTIVFLLALIIIGSAFQNRKDKNPVDKKKEEELKSDEFIV